MARSTRSTAPAATARPAATSRAKTSARSRRSPEIGTDRRRLDSYTYDLAVNQSTLYAGYPWRFAAFPQDVRLRQHAARRRVAARAVPAQRLGADAARPARACVETRPTVFYRGYDVYDPVKVGFVSNVAKRRRPEAISGSTRATPGNANAGHEGLRYGTELVARRQGRARRIPQDVLGDARWTLLKHRAGAGARSWDRARRAPGRRRAARLLRLVQVLPRGAAGVVDDRDAGDALPLRLHRRRERRRHPVLDLLRAAAHVSREASRAGRLRVAGRVVGAGPGAADRLHQEDRRLPARGEQLRGLPHHQLPRRPEREPGVHQRRAGTHAQPRGVLPLPRRLRQGSALQRRQPDARDQPRDRPAVRRSAGLPLPHHPDDQEAAASSARRSSRGSIATTFPTGAAAATTR